MQFEEGTPGELRVNHEHLTDASSFEALTAKRKVIVLPVGTELRVALTITSELPPTLLPHLLPHGATLHDPTTTISVESRFVGVMLLGPPHAQESRPLEVGGLWLSYTGMAFRGIKSGPVGLPKALRLEAVGSLNHAFTCLSELFEPWRNSHTGNIYERVFYREPHDRWYPLKDIRDPRLATNARPFLNELWERAKR